MRFYLGTHETSWLERLDVPLFISHRRLALRRQRLPVARGPWALDSGGFTELNKPPHRWVMTVDEYVEAVARYQAEIGGLEWAAPMDWMCEPLVLRRTGLSVREHQERTVANFLELRGRGPFVPVLQGWDLADYHRCVDLYEQAGVDLAGAELVGLGTVCRRQATGEIRRIVNELCGRGLALHGFGVKTAGLPPVAHLVHSTDSMAWSVYARLEWVKRRRQMCDGVGAHAGGCQNCSAWALRWRDRVLDGAGLWATER